MNKKRQPELKLVLLKLIEKENSNNFSFKAKDA